MTGEAISDFVRELDERARSARAAEEAFHREAAQRIATLERERAYAYRRLNLIRSVAAALADAEEEADAKASGAAAFMHEMGWTGASPVQRDVAARFEPVVLAIWTESRKDGGGEAGPIAEELEAFERWFSEEREAPFLSLLDKEIVGVPLVEG